MLTKERLCWESSFGPPASRFMASAIVLVMLLVGQCSHVGAFVIAPLPSSHAPSSSRVAQPAMLWRGAKGIPKGKVPENTKADECEHTYSTPIAHLQNESPARTSCITCCLTRVLRVPSPGRSKSWGLYEFLSNTLGGGSDEPDTGPKFGKNVQSRGADDAGNFKGDRRIFSKKC